MGHDDITDEMITLALIEVIPGFGECNSPAKCVGTCVRCLTRLRNPSMEELLEVSALLKDVGFKERMRKNSQAST